ncbi:MAG: hypothetical protein AAF547_20955 [Actinomycetota bacterium]
MTAARLHLWRLLLPVALLSTVLALAGPASGATDRAAGVGGDPIPDVVLLVSDVDGERRERLRDRLGGIDGVDRVTTSIVTGDRPATAFQLALVDRGTAIRDHAVVVDEARDVIAADGAGPAVDVGGASVVDRAIVRTYDGAVRLLAVLGLLVGGALGLVVGLRRGLVTAASIGLAVLAAGLLGRRVAGPFDGTIAGSGVPGALAGLVVAVVLAVRLSMWFRTPRGIDGAERIRLAVADLAAEVVLVLVGLALAAVLVGLMDPGPSPLTAITVGAVAAVAVVGAMLTPALALLADHPEARPGWLPGPIPDGRDLPLLLLSGTAVLLAVLALFGFGRPSVGLAGVEDLPAEAEAAMVAERLRAAGGDPTAAVVATAPAGSDQVDLQEWSRTAAELTSVAWVDVGSMRFTSIGAVDIDPADLLAPSETEGVAIVVLAVPSRGTAGQATVEELVALPLVGGPPTFDGPAIDAAGAAGSRSTLVVAVIALAATGAIVVRVLTQSRAQALVALLLRLLGGSAVLGVFGLVSGDVTAAVLVTGLGIVALAVGLFEAEFVTGDARPGTGPVALGGTVGLLVLVVGGALLAVAALGGSGPGTGTLGVGLVIGALIELTVGGLLLRPALLGQRAAFHTAVRPVRVVLHSGLERDAPDGAIEDPEWRRVIGDLLQAEFRFQADPSRAILSTVFVPDTPLYRQAAAHHASLAEAGLRIVGRSPRLRSIRTVSGRRPITLAITVDHPVRHLVDTDGTVRGIRNAERRSGILWLSESGDSGYRIAESVELGAAALPAERHDDPVGARPVLGERADVEALTAPPAPPDGRP